MSRKRLQDLEPEELEKILIEAVEDPDVQEHFEKAQSEARRLSKILRDSTRLNQEILRQPVTM